MTLPSWAAGCVVKVYQPMSGFHRPVVVDPQQPNLRDARLDVRCIPGNGLSPFEAGTLCRKVQALFENQGAVVTTALTEGNGDAEPAARRWGQPEPTVVQQVDTPEQAAARTPLSLDLRARRVHGSKHPLSWVMFVGSFTLLPGVLETTFVQDLEIRDGSGFLLHRDTLEGRLVSRYGAGPWLGNKIFNLWRDEEEKVVRDTAATDLSTDLYRQLSQIVFNAKLAAQVLEQVPPVAGRGE